MANQKISALVGEYDLDGAKTIELRRINRYTKNNPTIIWLANELGKRKSI
ncbi:MAG: hypothetical protein IPL65_06630 [Lewinellaceae bacterium]|nr:hypothetical protein [Lewinellaceae bacterium]